MGKTGLYIHIPFCAAKCPYCDFYSLPINEGLADAYTDAVLRAMDRGPWRGRPVDTVYFGGGTPLLMGPDRLGRILEGAKTSFQVEEGAEITLEANPASTLGPALRELRQAGFNRISFGVQSGIDSELSALGRKHTAGEGEQAILDAYAAGFSNISADLMLGIPGQTRESLASSIRFLSALPLTHISAYLLKVEEGTPFARDNIGAKCPGEDLAAQLYLDCVETLAEKGFRQYEISNFSKENCPSRHNLKYWELQPYLGIGPAAHSFVDGRRFYFPRDLQSFLGTENPSSLSVDDGEGGSLEEELMLRLRLVPGLPLDGGDEKRKAILGGIRQRATILVDRGLVEIAENTLTLTPEGFLLSNAVTAHLLDGVEE